MAVGKFDTGARAAEKLPESVIVGEHELKVNRSGDAMERVMMLDTGSEDAPEKEQAARAVQVLFQSLAYLLEDAEGNNPDPIWLKRNIDFEVASELLEALMPRGPEGPPPAPEPVPPSTPGSGESH